MTANQHTSLRPLACFVVEREPGKGYHVTSAEGSFADEWKVRALGLLDSLGQPDPKGPAEDFYWLGPIAPSGEYVGVSMKLMPNGEARYHQAWFQVSRPITRPMRSVGLWILVCLVIFAVGAVAGAALYAPGGPTTSQPVPGSGGLPQSTKIDSSTKDGPPDVRLAKLKVELASSREVLARLKGYLSQKGFAANTSTPVVDEKRSVKLIADLDRTPPPQETIGLSNIEVAKLVRLLKMLEELTTDGKSPHNPEGR